MNDTPPERSLSMWLTQGLLLATVIYFSIGMIATLLRGASNPIGLILYASLLLILPAISIFTFLKKLPLVHRLSILSLVCLWGWVLRALWIWSGLTPAGETSTIFQAILLLLTALSVGIPVLFTKLEFERRLAARLAEDSQNESDAYQIGSPVSFEDPSFDSKTEPSEFPKSFDN